MAERAASARVSTRALRRYSRHLLIPEVGLAGQERLSAARVLVIGAGGLGSPALEYLAAAGVGRLGIVDDDVVDETNLQRQTLFSTRDIGRSKVEAARDRLLELNPYCAVDPIAVRCTAENARDLIALYDVVLDCTDRFASRYLINDASRLESKTDVYASIFRFDAQVSVFTPDGPCYRCLFPEPPEPGMVPTCAEGGVLGVLAGIAGTWQANEALKVLLGIGKTLTGRILTIDALNAAVREVRFARDPACELCGAAPSIFSIEAARYAAETAAAETGAKNTIVEIDAAQLDTARERAVLLDVREPHEIVFGVLDGAVHIPASALEARLHELDSARTYIVACRMGMKSRWAAQRLGDAGFNPVLHLRDGLLAYAALHDEFLVF